MTNQIKTLALVFCLIPSLAISAETGIPNVPTDQLSQGLSDLRTSVDQMAASNEALAAKNMQLNDRLKTAQAMLQKLNQENQELSAAKMKAETPIPSQVKKVEELQKVSTELDVKMSDMSEQIKVNQEKVLASKKEDDALNEQINQIQNPAAPSDEELTPELAEIRQQKQKQKLAALKMISESQAHQMLLQEQILDAQKNIPQTEESQNVNRKHMLESDLRGLQQEISQLKDLTGGPAGQAVGADQLRKLQQSVDDLERNRKELSDLVVKMQKKAQKIHLTTEERTEQAKLQYNVDQLKTEAKTLRLDLEEAEQQMVELDKRKAQLELLLQK